MSTLPETLVSAAIKELRSEYILAGKSPSYFEINNGLCDDFAEEVLSRLHAAHGRREDLFTVWNENFFRIDDSYTWDADLLTRHWGIVPPEHFTWTMLDEVNFGGHAWLTSGGRHFDAECPDGVDSFFELPLFRRCLVYHLRKQGIDCPDVETEDVVPAPRCPVVALAA